MDGQPAYTRPPQTSVIAGIIPAELLSAIFIETCAQVDDQSSESAYRRTQTRLDLSGVCLQWRAVAHECPFLWTYLALDAACLKSQSVAMANLARLKTWLARAKACPLDVVLDLTTMPPDVDSSAVGGWSYIYDAPPVQAFLTMLKWQARNILRPWLAHLTHQSIAQLRSFNWTSNHLDHQWLIPAVFKGLQAAPLLESLVIKHDIEGQRICDAPSFTFDAPRLRGIALRSVNVHWTTATIFQGLTALSIDGSGVDRDINDVEISPRPGEFLAILRACPNLVLLSLKDTEPAQWDPTDFGDQVVRLDKLRSLTLNFLDTYFLRELLLRVSITALCDLRIINTAEDSYGMLFALHQAGLLVLSNLTKLSLRLTANRPPPDDTRMCFALLTRLEELEFASRQWQLNFLLGTPASFLCPRLKKVTIHFFFSQRWYQTMLGSLSQGRTRLETLVLVVTADPPLDDSLRTAILTNSVLASVAGDVQLVEKCREWGGFASAQHRSAWWGVLEHRQGERNDHLGHEDKDED